jgi:hypothetical protein
MSEKPGPTPQALRHRAERAIRLAHGILDKSAKEALQALAQELLEKATQLEAATSAEAVVPTIAPTEGTGTPAAMLDSADSPKPPDDKSGH